MNKRLPQPHPGHVLALVLLLLALTMRCAEAAQTISLPDNGVYYYWILSSQGSVESAPKTSSGTGSIDLHAAGQNNGVLFVLDRHTGGIAQLPLSDTAKNAAINVSQFHLPASAPSAPAPSTSPQAPSAPSATTPAPAPDNGGSLLSKIVTSLLGIAVFGGVIWFVRLLILTKGQLLIDSARKVGINVPNPDDLPKTTIEGDGKYDRPAPPPVQRVPDEAMKPISRPSSAGYVTTAEGTSYAIGTKPLSIGRSTDNDIVLADSSVSRRHARVESTGEIAELIDEGSANGIFVNGQPVQRQILTAGDNLLIGSVPLKYEK